MNSFRAAILRGQNKISVETVYFDELPPRSVLVQVALTGLCRSQLMEYQGNRGNDRWLPHLFGHEAVGRVVDFGDRVSCFNIGDKVILTWLSPPSVDFVAPSLRDSFGQLVNSGRVATFGEFAIVDQSCCIKQPRNIRDEVAVLFGCALGTGAGMAINATRDRKKLRKYVFWAWVVLVFRLL